MGFFPPVSQSNAIQSQGVWEILDVEKGQAFATMQSLAFCILEKAHYLPHQFKVGD